MKLYIIGIDHKYQYGPCHDFDCKKEEIDSFKSYLKSSCTQLNIKIIAEEMSKDALDQYGIAKSIPQLVSEELNLVHAFFDLNKADKKAKGIFSRNEIIRNGFSDNLTVGNIKEKITINYDEREYEWIKNILNFSDDPILAICGFDHPNSFEKKALERGINAHILNMNWEPTIEN